MPAKSGLLSGEKRSLLNHLEHRFKNNMHRHTPLQWKDVLAKLEIAGKKMWSLSQMELTGGEPDVIGFDAKNNEYIFCDCSKESPAGRRNLCYDREALDSRKEHKPANNVLEVATSMGIDVLDEDQYRNLQRLEPFDTKTSSWIMTPPPIRKLGGALFGDYRYDSVFIYHNGASSYYAARGFRGKIQI